MTDLTPQAAVLTAAFSHAPATPPQAPPAAPAPTAPSPSVHPTAPITASQAATMADWTRQDVAAGKISAEQADKIFSELNVPLDQRVTPGETRSDEQKLVDEQFPAARPEDFSISYGPPGQAPSMTSEMKQFDQSARTWLSGAEISRVSRQTENMNADELESYGYAEFAKLEKCYGRELDAKLQQAAVMIDALDQKTPGLKQLLKSKGLGDNALVVAQIIGQSERWHARRKGR